ncbi:Unknown protein sequence [Pseudomonas coronafaciens pv. oryzae]|nr:Unknown protein sequence [Pseudomonas coronafaciens pv. oryzae]
MRCRLVLVLRVIIVVIMLVCGGSLDRRAHFACSRILLVAK